MLAAGAELVTLSALGDALSWPGVDGSDHRQLLQHWAAYLCLIHRHAGTHSHCVCQCGPIAFLPADRASIGTDGIPVTSLQGSITWPSIGTPATVPTTQLMFFPTPGQNYGQIASQASGYDIIALGSQLRASTFATSRTYSFSVNGCYR
jgi:hypothetical protein